MDVDVDNFEEVYNNLNELLPKASFVAVDLEMTGIQGVPAAEASAGDTPYEKYWKGLLIVNKPFNIVQIGLSLFIQERHLESFTCYSFSFYVFPRSIEEIDANGNPMKDDPYVGLSSSTVTFLQDNGLDLGRWLTKGISYTSPAMEEALLANVAALESATSEVNGQQAVDQREGPEPTTVNDIRVVEDVMKKVHNMVAQGEGEMKLPGMNNFLALILRHRIAQRRDNLVVEKRPSSFNPNLTDRWVVVMTEERKRARAAAAKQKAMHLLGFRRVWKLLKERQAPIIVHNGFFDLLFLTAALERPLPDGLKDWKRMVHDIFPYILDTKYLAEEVAELRGRLGNRSALPELAAALDKKLAHVAAQDGGSATQGEETLPLEFTAAEQFAFTKGDAYHNAAFDAFTTGKVFAYYRYLLKEDGKILPYANHIFLMFSGFHMRLAEAVDQWWVKGITMHVNVVDPNFANNRSLQMMFKTLTEDGQHRVNFRWCGDRSGALFLILQGPHTEAGDPEREALEETFIRILKDQQASGRLEYCTLEEHLKSYDVVEEVVEAVPQEADEEGGEDAEPSSKRHKTA